MNHSAFRTLMTLGFFLVLTCASVSAQNVESRLSVNVPFAFTVGGQTLPAGQYTIRYVPYTPNLLQIQSADRQAHTALWSTRLEKTGQTPAHTTLVFREYGEQRFLAEVRIEGDKQIGVLIPSRHESELAKSTHAKTNILAVSENQRRK